jgi:hypothetical protein
MALPWLASTITLPLQPVYFKKKEKRLGHSQPHNDSEKLPQKIGEISPPFFHQVGDFVIKTNIQSLLRLNPCWCREENQFIFYTGFETLWTILINFGGYSANPPIETNKNLIVVFPPRDIPVSHTTHNIIQLSVNSATYGNSWT